MIRINSDLVADIEMGSQPVSCTQMQFTAVYCVHICEELLPILYKLL